jgi:hypothetical protein
MGSELVTKSAVVVRGLNVQAHKPSVTSPHDAGGQDSGARRHHHVAGARMAAFDGTQKPPQPPGIVVHADDPNLRQGNCPETTLPHTDPVTATSILLVAETKAVAIASLALASREAHPLAPALRVSIERPAKINGCLLKHLGGNLLTPRQPGHLFGCSPTWSDNEHASCALAGLPCVEGVDQVEP